MRRLAAIFIRHSCICTAKNALARYAECHLNHGAKFFEQLSMTGRGSCNLETEPGATTQRAESIGSTSHIRVLIAAQRRVKAVGCTLLATTIIPYPVQYTVEHATICQRPRPHDHKYEDERCIFLQFLRDRRNSLMSFESVIPATHEFCQQIVTYIKGQVYIP